MPDKWEYPWFAAWDLAFHMIPSRASIPRSRRSSCCCSCASGTCTRTARSPPTSSRSRREPAGPRLGRVARLQDDRPARRARPRFLERVFQKLLINFTWWVNRKDPRQAPLRGGFLGLDNIGVFDRSKPLPTGGHLEQADGTAWMAFYCDHARHGARTRPRRRPRLRGHRLEVLRALRRHRRRDEHARRHRAVGRGRRLLLRPDPPTRSVLRSTCSTKANSFPPTACARCLRRPRDRSPSSSATEPRPPRRTTSPANPTPASSAATPTGAAPSGSR
jgi:hypothetical protein